MLNLFFVGGTIVESRSVTNLSNEFRAICCYLGLASKSVLKENILGMIFELDTNRTTLIWRSLFSWRG
jgi:hypothetical protein